MVTGHDGHTVAIFHLQGVRPATVFAPPFAGWSFPDNP